MEAGAPLPPTHSPAAGAAGHLSDLARAGRDGAHLVHRHRVGEVAKVDHSGGAEYAARGAGEGGGGRAGVICGAGRLRSCARLEGGQHRPSAAPRAAAAGQDRGCACVCVRRVCAGGPRRSATHKRRRAPRAGVFGPRLAGPNQGGPLDGRTRRRCTGEGCVRRVGGARAAAHARGAPKKPRERGCPKRGKTRSKINKCNTVAGAHTRATTAGTPTPGYSQAHGWLSIERTNTTSVVLESFQCP